MVALRQQFGISLGIPVDIPCPVSTFGTQLHTEHVETAYTCNVYRSPAYAKASARACRSVDRIWAHPSGLFNCRYPGRGECKTLVHAFELRKRTVYSNVSLMRSKGAKYNSHKFNYNRFKIDDERERERGARI